MSLNMSEHSWLNCSDYAGVLSMPRQSYKNIIIIVTNVIILELLSARFLHPGALLPIGARARGGRGGSCPLPPQKKKMKKLTFSGKK